MQQNYYLHSWLVEWYIDKNLKYISKGLEIVTFLISI